ncbi:MAG: DUF4260 family protein [Chloroflexota bacterium]
MNTAVGLILRAEQIAIFATGVVLWLANGGPPLLLIPAWLLVVPLALIGVGWWTQVGWMVLAGAVFTTHVGLDRALGYGLKLPTDFRDTHLGRIGKG